VGMPPAIAGAAIASLQVMQAEPERVQKLQQRGQFFLELANNAGIDTGSSTGLAVIPAIVGSSVRAARLSSAMFDRCINVQPILYPAVPEKSARLRFFLSSEHTEEQIRTTITTLAEELDRL